MDRKMRPKCRDNAASTWDSHIVIETCGPVESAGLESASDLGFGWIALISKFSRSFDDTYLEGV